MTAQNETYLRVKEASEFLGLTKSQIYHLSHKKLITCYKPTGKIIYFKKSDLENFILSGEVLSHKAKAFELTSKRG